MWILWGQQRCSPSGWVTDAAIAQQEESNRGKKIQCLALASTCKYVSHIYTHTTYTYIEYHWSCLKFKYVSHVHSQYTCAHCIMYTHKNKYTFIKIGIIPLYVYVCFMCLFISLSIMFMYIYAFLYMCMCLVCVFTHVQVIIHQGFYVLDKAHPLSEKKKSIFESLLLSKVTKCQSF